ncbi:hypothetical protein D3C84_650380 [compost metagenome]
MHQHLAGHRHRLVADTAGTDDRHLRRHHHRVGVTAEQGAEIGQGEGRAHHLLGRDRARLDVGAQARNAFLQVLGRARADVAQHRHEQTVRGIHGDAQIELGVTLERQPLAIEPAVEHRFGLTGGGDRLGDAHQWIARLRPAMQIGVADNEHRHHLGVRARHVDRHAAPHPAQLVAAELVAGRLGRGFDIAPGDQASAAGTDQATQVDAQLAGQLAHRRGRARRQVLAGRRRGADEEAVRLRLAAAFQTTDHGAGIGLALVGQQRLADMQDVAFGAEGLGHHTVVGRGDIDDGLGGFHRDQQLVGLDRLAGLDVPLDDLGLLQAFAQVGQFEVFHLSFSPRFACPA